MFHRNGLLKYESLSYGVLGCLFFTHGSELLRLMLWKRFSVDNAKTLQNTLTIIWHIVHLREPSKSLVKYVQNS